MPAIPVAEWEWFGNAGHFICGQWCRFHLCTKIGKYLVSTVGEYVHPRHGKGSEVEEGRWLAQNPLGEDIGLDRKFETMVFRLKGRKRCDCGCDLPVFDGHEIGYRGCNDRAQARRNHMELCYQWASEKAQRAKNPDDLEDDLVETEPTENIEGRNTW